MIEPINCPLCGGHGIVKDRFLNGVSNRKAYWVVCGKCQLKLQDRNSRKKAVEAWNARVPQPPNDRPNIDDWEDVAR